MALVDVISIKGEKVSQVELSENIFNVPVKSHVLHDVVLMQLACRRSGTASVKHRSDIRGSRRKLYRQKGTGRARRGDIKSPLLRGGGVVFGPDKRSYKYSVPKKVRRLALKMALSCKLNENEIIIIDRFNLDQIKTKQFVSIIKQLNATNALIVLEKKDDILELSSRNVPNIKVLRSEGLTVYDALKYKNLILVESSIKPLEERLSV